MVWVSRCKKGSAAALTIVPRSVPVSSDAPASSQRINLACIGVGDMGMGDMQDLMGVDGVQVVAVCDIAKAVGYGRREHGIAGLDAALRRVARSNSRRAKSGSYKG
jgi:predicted homoserine dehydrogenase-like protein